METSPPKPAVHFPRFLNLAAELRSNIWLQALPDTDRAIRLAMHHYTHSTMHSCVTVDGNFCGCHSRCPRYTEGQPSHIGVCMADGFFAVAEGDEDPEDDIVSGTLLRSLGLACRESREIVTRAYPETVRVWEYVNPVSAARGGWDHGCRRSRQVRCNPATDILVITSMPDYSSLHPADDGPNHGDTQLAKQFSRDPEAFRHFRKIISSFQCVALDYIGNRADGLDDDDDIGDGDYESDDGQRRSEEVIRTPDTVILLFWFESLRQLSLWPNPRWWPEVLVGNRIWVDDVRMLHYDYDELSDTLEILVDYRQYARIQQGHAAADEQLHWVARPRPLPSRSLVSACRESRHFRGLVSSFQRLVLGWVGSRADDSDEDGYNDSGVDDVEEDEDLNDQRGGGEDPEDPDDDDDDDDDDDATGNDDDDATGNEDNHWAQRDKMRISINGAPGTKSMDATGHSNLLCWFDWKSRTSSRFIPSPSTLTLVLREGVSKIGY
ncbi:hypothetical protein PG988_009515 [Apiospora saccharicola]